MPCSADCMRRRPSKWNGLVTTPMVRMPCSRAAAAMTGAAPVPVPPPMPAVTNTMLAPSSSCRISGSASSAAWRPTSGRAPAPRPWVMVMPSWTRRSASDWPSAWASVLATMNSTPSSAALIMLLTAFPPAPPTPTTVIRGLISDSFWGRLRLIVITAFSTQTRGLSARSSGVDPFLAGPFTATGFSCFLSIACGDCLSPHNILPKSSP